MAKLTEQRRRILSVLAREENRNHANLDAHEIAVACGEARRASDWAHGKLREMAFYGLVEPRGVTFSNSRTWAITDLGRLALQQEVEGR